MSRLWRGAERIIRILREADVELATGETVVAAFGKRGASEHRTCRTLVQPKSKELRFRLPDATNAPYSFTFRCLRRPQLGLSAMRGRTDLHMGPQD